MTDLNFFYDEREDKVGVYHFYDILLTVDKGEFVEKVKSILKIIKRDENSFINRIKSLIKKFKKNLKSIFEKREKPELNPDFEKCKTLSEEDLFHYGLKVLDCDNCDFRKGCSKGEFLYY